MISSIKIENFKTVTDLKLDLGRFNVLIGENGCGKSNILEAIAFASAASAGQLEVHDLERRGMRVPSHKFMLSAFEENHNKEITVVFTLLNGEREKFCMSFLSNPNSEGWIEKGARNAEDLIRTFKQIGVRNVNEALEVISSKNFNDYDNLHLSISSGPDKITFGPVNFDKSITNFKIFSPNEHELRRFDNPEINSLGVHGSGLFSYLKKLAASENGATVLHDINDCMRIFDWFNVFEVPKSNLSNDNTILFHDQYIDDSLKFFDQRSVNEGFLYLLFFFTLFISDSTPFFAIDNIESALNPKLCKRFTRSLISLASRYNKQVIVTTHNPFVLDALDLANDDQRLIVARRNSEGHTRVSRIRYKADNNVPLSEAWMKGYIGGLPNNF